MAYKCFKNIAAVVLVLAMIFLLTACKSKDYKAAVALYEEGKYTQAAAMFDQLGDYKDSQDMLIPFLASISMS